MKDFDLYFDSMNVQQTGTSFLRVVYAYIHISHTDVCFKVCAHLWKLRDTATGLYTVGRCHLINKNLRDVASDRPFRFTTDELYGIYTGYHAAFGMIGFSAAKTKVRC